MGDLRIHVTTVRSGQRAYADHVSIYRLKIEWVSWDTRKEPEFEPCEWTEDLIRPICKGIHGWLRDSRQGETCGNFHESYLKSIAKIGPGEWEWTVVLPYLD